MVDIEIQVTDILVINQTRYRVIGYQKGLFSICKMDTSKLKILLFKAEDIVGWLRSNEAEIQKNDAIEFHQIHEDDDYKKKKQIIQFVVREYGPMYDGLSNKATKFVLSEEAKRLGILPNTLWRTIRKFLQAGLDMSSIVDGRSLRTGKRKSYTYTQKTGRPSTSSFGKGIPLTEEVRAHFEEAKRLYLSGRARTKKDAYLEMIQRHYIYTEDSPTGIQVRVLPENKRPTLTQLENYLRNTITEEELDKAKTSAREQRNNKRLLLSDNLQGVKGPGDLWEVDECEIDVSLVSVDNPSVTVGRPILYIMVDVYSRMIVAYSVAFDNNSVIGITNCFLNLIEDKKALCARFDIPITADEWPSHILPHRLRSDYGSEYVSHEMDKICKELGITKELVPPATGSLKGQVEQIFHQVHAAQNPLLEGKGLIEKRYDSNYHKEATLNIHEFESVLLTFIVAHNRKYMENYPMTKDMRNHDIVPKPVVLWKYGVESNGNPTPIVNEELFRYTLLLPVKASVGREGITCQGLFYINLTDEWLLRDMYLSSESGKKKLETARIDPRNITYLYYIRNGKLMTATLNLKKTGMADYDGLTLSEYKIIHQKKKEFDAVGHEENLLLDIAVRSRQQRIISEASSNVKKTAPQNLRKSRAQEKHTREQSMLVIPQPQATEVIPEKTTPVETSTEPITPISTEEALRMFNEGDDFYG